MPSELHLNKFSDSVNGLTRNFASPLVSREKFAEMVGLPVGVIVGFINKGYIPTVSIGKYSLVNVAAIQQSCSQKEFSL